MQILLTILATTVIVGICFLIFNRTSYIWLLNQARRKGFFLTPRKPTLEDVRHLLLSGERDMAIRVYSEMYKINLKQAELEVDLLERNLQKKL